MMPERDMEALVRAAMERTAGTPGLDQITERVASRAYPARRFGVRRVAAVVGIVPAVAAVAVAVLMATAGPSAPERHGLATPPESGPHQPTVALSGGEIMLAGAVFHLPSGYEAVAHQCLPVGAVTSVAVPVVGDQFSAAASSAGGCVQADLVGSVGLLGNLMDPQRVGPYAAYEVRSAGTTASLLIEIPTLGGPRHLVLSATSLDATQLLAVARSGLSPTVSPSHCSGDCG